MSKVSQINISNLSNISDLIRFLNPFCSQTFNALNNGVNFQDNFLGAIVTYYFGSTASQNIVHNLNSTPLGYLAIRQTAPCLLFDGTSPALSNSSANIKCSVVGVTVTILFF